MMKCSSNNNNNKDMKCITVHFMLTPSTFAETTGENDNWVVTRVNTHLTKSATD